MFSVFILGAFWHEKKKIFEILNFFTIISTEICRPLAAKPTNLNFSKMAFLVVFSANKGSLFWDFGSPKAGKTRGGHNVPLDHNDFPGAGLNRVKKWN